MRVSGCEPETWLRVPAVGRAERAPHRRRRMSDVMVILLILGAWLALQYVVLPRLGVPT